MRAIAASLATQHGTTVGMCSRLPACGLMPISGPSAVLGANSSQRRALYQGRMQRSRSRAFYTTVARATAEKSERKASSGDDTSTVSMEKTSKLLPYTPEQIKAASRGASSCPNKHCLCRLHCFLFVPSILVFLHSARGSRYTTPS